MGKFQHHALHHLAFKRRERIWIGGINRRERAASQRIRLSVDLHRPVFKINVVQNPTALHAVFRMAAEQLPFELELQNGGGLVHARQLHLVLVQLLAVVARQKRLARVIRIVGGGQRRQRAQRNAVADLERFQIAVFHGGHDHLRDASLRERRRAHPRDVVVAPLHIDLMVVFQRVHNQIGARPAVKDIADDVQPVDGQRLNHVAERDNHRVGLPGFQYGLHHLAVIAFLVRRVVAEQHFLHQRAHPSGHRVAHALAGVFHRAHPADLEQPIDRQPIPFRIDNPLLFEQRQLLVRVIDQRGEHVPLVAGQDIAV